MIWKFWIAFIFIILNTFQISYAANIFSNLNVNKSVAPYILELILNHIQTSQLTDSETKLIATELQQLNQNISSQNKPDQQFFIISELYKAVLNYDFKKKSSSDTIDKKQIENLSTLLLNYKVIYTPFSAFIIQSTINDFQEFTKDGFLDNYQATKSSRNSSYLKENQLKKVLKYSGQWVSLISSIPAEKFNNICTDLLIEFIKNTARQSSLFKLHAQKSLKPVYPLEGFQSPTMQNILNNTADIKNEQIMTETTAPVSTISSKAKAQQVIKDLNVDPVEKAADDIDLIFKNNTFND